MIMSYDYCAWILCLGSRLLANLIPSDENCKISNRIQKKLNDIGNRKNMERSSLTFCQTF